MMIAISNAEFALAIFLVLVALATLFGPAICIGIWILAPIDRAAKSRKTPVRFSIGDFLCLFVMIQVPLAAVYRLRDGETSRGMWFATFLAWVVAMVIWYAGARTLSKAGVYHSGHRFVYLGLILPLVYYGLLPYTFFTWWLVVNPESNPDLGQLRLGTWTVITWAVLSGLYLLSMLFTRWMLKQPRLMEVEALIDPPEFEIERVGAPNARTLADPSR